MTTMSPLLPPTMSETGGCGDMNALKWVSQRKACSVTFNPLQWLRIS